MMVIAEPPPRKEVNIHSQKLYCEAISKGVAVHPRMKRWRALAIQERILFARRSSPIACAVCQSADFVQFEAADDARPYSV